jgi:hypothetical protein
MSSSSFSDSDVRFLRFHISNTDGSSIESSGIIRLDPERECLVVEYMQKSGWDSLKNVFAEITVTLGSLGDMLTGDDDKDEEEEPRRKRAGEEPRHLEIPFAHLDYLRVHNRLFWRTLVLSTDSLKYFAAFPSHDSGRLKVKVKFEDWRRARPFVSRVNLALADFRLRQENSGESDLEARFRAL